MKTLFTLSFLCALSAFTEAVQNTGASSLRETMKQALGVENGNNKCSGKKKCGTTCQAYGDPHIKTFSNQKFLLKGANHGLQPLYGVKKGKNEFVIETSIETNKEGEYMTILKFGKQKYDINKDCAGVNGKSVVIKTHRDLTSTFNGEQISAEIKCSLPGPDTVKKKGVDPNKYHFDIEIKVDGRGNNPNFDSEWGACVHSDVDRSCGCTCDILCNDQDLEMKKKCGKASTNNDKPECYNYWKCMSTHGCGDVPPPSPSPSTDCQTKLDTCFKQKKVSTDCQRNPEMKNCKNAYNCYSQHNCPMPSGCTISKQEDCEQNVPGKCFNGVDDKDCHKYYKCLEKKPPCPVPQKKCDEATKKACKNLKYPSMCKDIKYKEMPDCKSYYKCFEDAGCPPPSSTPTTAPPSGPSIKENQKIVCTSHCASKGDPHFASFYGGKWKVPQGIKKIYIYKNEHQEITGDVEDLSKNDNPMDFITAIHWKFGNKKGSFSRSSCEKPGHKVDIKNKIDDNFNGKPMSSQIDGYILCEAKNNIKGAYQLKIRFAKRDRFIAGYAPKAVNNVHNMIDVETNWLNAPLQVKGHKNDIWGCNDHNPTNMNDYTRAECKLKDKWDNETNQNSS